MVAGAACLAMALGACASGGTTTTAEETVVETDTAVVEEHPETTVVQEDITEVVETEEGDAPAMPVAQCPEGDVTLRILTFNNFGFSEPTAQRAGADLWNKYHELCPNVTIEETVAATSDDARAQFNTSIAAGQAAFDIFAAEIDWMPSVQALEAAVPGTFVDLAPYVGDNQWVEWASNTGKTPDGSKTLGFSTDVGPQGVCYRSDLLDAAGIPSDRESVKEWLGGDNGTWADFFAAGHEYVEKSGGKAFFDSMAPIMQGMVNQVEYSWVDADGNIIAADNQQMHDLYNQLTAAAAEGQSAGLQQWSDNWNSAMGTDQFAVTLCPPWLINNIRGAAGDDFVGWDIADQFPNGGGNWGGSFLVVPSAGAHTEAAADAAAWITAAEQQEAIFEAASNFPSELAAQASGTVQNRTEPFLNNAPIGQIFSDRAHAVNVVPYKGAQYFDVQTAMADALNRVDVDGVMNPEQSWEQFLNDVRALS